MEIGMQMTGQRSDASTVDRDGDGLWGGGVPEKPLLLGPVLHFNKAPTEDIT